MEVLNSKVVGVRQRKAALALTEGYSAGCSPVIFSLTPRGDREALILSRYFSCENCDATM